MNKVVFHDSAPVDPYLSVTHHGQAVDPNKIVLQDAPPPDTSTRVESSGRPSSGIVDAIPKPPADVASKVVAVHPGTPGARVVMGLPPPDPTLVERAGESGSRVTDATVPGMTDPLGIARADGEIVPGVFPGAFGSSVTIHGRDVSVEAREAIAARRLKGFDLPQALKNRIEAMPLEDRERALRDLAGDAVHYAKGLVDALDSGNACLKELADRMSAEKGAPPVVPSVIDSDPPPPEENPHDIVRPREAESPSADPAIAVPSEG